jgi:hypothetical protein
VAGWVVIKVPFARQLLSLGTCANLAASESIHEGAERASSGKAGTATPNPTIPAFREQSILASRKQGLPVICCATAS